MDSIRVAELTNEIQKKLLEELKIKDIPKIKISFPGTDALWISEGEAKVRGKNDSTEYYKFWEASEFKDFTDAEAVLNDENQMQKVERIEVVYSTGKKEFDSWKEFLRWLES